MFRERCSAVLVLFLMLAVNSAEAGELGLFIDSRVGGDSNVLRSGARKVKDAFFEFSPRLSLRETEGDLTYNLVYRPTFVTFAETEDIDGVDHFISGDGQWNITPIDSVSFKLRHSNLRRLRYDDTAAGSAPSIQQPSDRNRLRLTDGQLAYSRQFTSDWSGWISVDIDDFDPAPDNRGAEADSRAYSARVGANHAFDSRTSVGLSVSGRFRDSRVQLPVFPPERDPPNFPSTKTIIWDVAINVSRQLSDTMSISAQVGPSFISTKLVPDIAAREDNSTVYNQETSIFAVVSFLKRWQKARLDASYVRSEFRGGFTTSATISDDVNVDFKYDLSRRLEMRVNAGWNQRKQIVDVPGVDNVDTVQWRTILLSTYRLTRQLSLLAEYAFRRQDIDGSENSSGVGDTHTGFLSLRYTFDPIIF